MSQVTTHVLDISAGKPAAGVLVILEVEKAGGWKEVSREGTDADGRARNLLAPGSLVEGTYRLTFHTKTYFASGGITGLFPAIVVVFEVRDAKEHYHIPLLLSPFGYSIYRGS